MDSSQISHLLSNNSLFGGVYSCDTIPKTDERPIAFVVNTHEITSPGEHWQVILLVDNHKIEFFDSFGFPPDVSFICDYIDDNATDWCYSSKTLQHPHKQSCGMFCVSFIQCRDQGGTYRDFLNEYTKDLLHNEKIVWKNGARQNHNHQGIRRN